MNRLVNEFELAKKNLAKDIIGEIALSEHPEIIIKKWRTIFKISQKRLANELGITSSVVSDYESGRRKSPGIRMIKKYVSALLDIDASKGGPVTQSFIKQNIESTLSDAILDIREFGGGISIGDFFNHIKCIPVTKAVSTERNVYGYTVIDSLKAITELSFSELIKLYGMTTERVLIFTKVSTGKTPMVAIKLTNLHPAAVVLHGLDVVDEVAKRIAEVENIPLAVSKMESVDDMIKKLKEIV